MKTVEIRISSKSNFAKAVGFAKKAGGTFNAGTKTWNIPAHRPELNAPGAYGWAIVAPTVDPATTWVGQASMDHEDSIF